MMRTRLAFASTVLSLLLLNSAASAQENTTPPLVQVADIPLPGAAVRFDYQSFDPTTGRLYIAHMNANQLVVFDTRTKSVLGNLDGFPRVHGVIAIPELGRVYASITGAHKVAAVDAHTLIIIATAGPIDYPDGLAYSPATHRVFVSDEHGGVDAVIDTKTDKLITSIPLDGGAGNTVYDAGSGNILVAVHGRNQLAIIDPESMAIKARYPLPGLVNPHGIALDLPDRLAFIAGEENHSLALFDLATMKLLQVYPVGDDPDVLAYDPGLHRLYVSAESGTVAVFQQTGRELRRLGTLQMPHAHTVSVDPATHLVYFPLQDVDGHPVLRIMKPNP